MNKPKKKSKTVSQNLRFSIREPIGNVTEERLSVRFMTIGRSFYFIGQYLFRNSLPEERANIYKW